MLSEQQLEERRRWIIESFHRWFAWFGEQPTATDWNPELAIRVGHPEKAERWQQGHWPRSSQVQDAFGTWNNGLVAAGLTPKRQPRPKKDASLSTYYRKRKLKGVTGAMGLPPGCKPGVSDTARFES